MIQYESKNYIKVLPLFKKSKHNIPMIRSVIEGKLKGKIFSNLNQDTIIVVTHFNWFCVLGDQLSNKFKKDFSQFIEDEIMSKNDHFAWFGIDDYWKKQLTFMYGKNIISYPRVKFTYKNKNSSNTVSYFSLPPEYTIKMIDGNLVEKASDFFDGIEMFWGNSKNFLTNSFGFCMLHKEKIISICQCCAITDNLCEMDVFTSKDYRGHKLGYLTCLAFIEYCLKMNLKPYWETARVNSASCKLAVKLGFNEVEEYPFYTWFKNK